MLVIHYRQEEQTMFSFGRKESLKASDYSHHSKNLAKWPMVSACLATNVEHSEVALSLTLWGKLYLYLYLYLYLSIYRYIYNKKLTHAVMEVDRFQDQQSANYKPNGVSSSPIASRPDLERAEFLFKWQGKKQCPQLKPISKEEIFSYSGEGQPFSPIHVFNWLDDV